MECTDFDAAPFPIKQERFRPTWECLSQEATFQLLKQINPRIVLDGHTHHGCTRKLPNGDGIEVTISSFSWRNKENPNFVMGVFTPNNYALLKCEMPNEMTVIGLYIIGGALLLGWLVLSFVRRGKTKYKYR